METDLFIHQKAVKKLHCVVCHAKSGYQYVWMCCIMVLCDFDTRLLLAKIISIEQDHLRMRNSKGC